MKHLGIITPLTTEARWFTKPSILKKPVSLTENISLIVSGEGKVNAREAALALLNNGADGLLVIGMAGALSPELSSGDLVIPDNIMTDSNRVFHCHLEWSEQLREKYKLKKNKITNSPLFTSDEVITNSIDKIGLYNQFNVCAVDMESSAVVALANEQKVPSTVMRVIIDPANYSFPDYLLTLTNEFGDVPVLRLIMTALTHPQQLNKLIQLLNFYHHASETLKILSKRPENLIASHH